jgi:sugar/nucleoside kinase (ribokinase family)
VGEDPAGEVLRSMLAAEGVTWIGSPHGSTPTTAILSTPAGAAMATAFGDDEPTADDVAAVDARAVALSLGRLPLRPSKAAVYATTGGIELDAGVRIDNVSLDGVRAVILNEGEATRLTNTDEAPVAARKLAEHVACAVVTLGARGAVAVENGREVRAVAPDIEVVDATGAGDLFIPAYVWADLRGVDVETRVAWASLYAGLSVRAPTAFEGAVTIGELLAEGSRRELPEPV